MTNQCWKWLKWNQRPCKPGGRHRNYHFTLSHRWDIVFIRNWCNGRLICILRICKWVDDVGIGKIRLRDPLNLGVDINISILSGQIRKLWPKKEILVMADLISILHNLPKGAKLAPRRFWISNHHRYIIRKKNLCRDAKTTLTPKYAFHNWIILP